MPAAQPLTMASEDDNTVLLSGSNALPAFAVSLLLLASVNGCDSAQRHLPRDDAPPVNVLCILLDTLRPDVLGAYGGDPGVAPTLDSLAATGLLCDRLYSQAPWTRPAVGTLLTSRYPQELGIDHGGHNGVMQALPDEAAYLPESFRSAGYAVAAVQSNPHLKLWTRFDRGFRPYDFIAESHRDQFRARAESLLDSLAMGESPFFLYLHLMEPHLPYIRHPDLPAPAPKPPPAPTSGFRPDVVRRRLLTSAGLSAEMQKWIRHVYAEDVRFADLWLGQLLARLRATGEADNTLILVLSDHGEEFWEHGGAEHGHTLHRELLWVPGIWVLPKNGGGKTLERVRAVRASRLQEIAGGDGLEREGGPAVSSSGGSDGAAVERRGGGQRLRAPMRLLDVAPTLLDLCDLPPLDGARGRSYAAAFASDEAPPFDATLAEGLLYGAQQRALITPRWKLIRNLETNAESLYDRERDPAETRDLIATCDPSLRAALEASLDSLAATCAPLGASLVPLDAATRKQLESLGYLGG
jgi:arylsulfatase A-like enzyme